MDSPPWHQRLVSHPTTVRKAYDGSVTAGLQLVPLEIFEKNLIRMIHLLRERTPRAGIIVVSPAICDNDAWLSWLHNLGYIDGGGLLHIHSLESSKQYADAVAEVCREQGVDVVNAYEAFEEALKDGRTRADLLFDGLHYTPAGNHVSRHPHAQRLTLPGYWGED